MTTTYTPADALHGHTSKDTALEVGDYPYGYTLRTTIRYWIETTKNGDRFVSQTLNPKTDRWNKPKKSTYSEVMVMVRDPENGHISYVNLAAHSKPETAEYIRAMAGDNLSDAQKRKMAVVIGMAKVFEKVEFTIREGKPTPEDVAAQAETDRRINRAIAVESHRALGTL